MKKLMTLRKRLFWGFGFVMVILILLGIIAVFSINRVNNGLEQFVKKDYPFLNNLLNIKILFLRITSAESAILSLDITADDREKFIKQFEEDKKAIERFFTNIDAMGKTEQEKKMWENFKTAFAIWLNNCENM